MKSDGNPRALSHLRFQRDRLAIHHKCAEAMVVDGLGILLLGVGPGLEHLKDEEIVSVDEARIGDFAFEIGEALGHQRHRPRIAGTGVRPKAANLSMSRPDELPTFTTLGANSSAGTAITHSPVARNAAKL